MAVDSEYLKSIGLDDESVISKIAEKSAEEERGLVAKRDELLGKVTSYKERLTQYDGVDIDEYAKLKKRMAELDEKNLMDKGQFDELLSKKEQEWQDKYGDLEGSYGQLLEQVKTKERDTAILSAVGDKGDGDTILDIVKSRGLVKAIDKDGELVLQVTGIDGKELESVGDLIKEMEASDKYKRLFNASGLSGSGAHTSTTTATNDPKVFGAARMRAAREQK